MSEFHDTLAALTAVLEPPRKGKKRGPNARGNVEVHVILPTDIVEWGKQQPEGMSGLCRRLLTAERRHQMREAKP